MIEVKTKIKKWGNSFGIIVPSGFLEQENIKEGDEVTTFITGEKKVNLKNLFGKHKFNKPIEKLMRETDDELYDE